WPLHSVSGHPVCARAAAPPMKFSRTVDVEDALPHLRIRSSAALMRSKEKSGFCGRPSNSVERVWPDEETTIVFAAFLLSECVLETRVRYRNKEIERE